MGQEEQADAEASQTADESAPKISESVALEIFEKITRQSLEQ